MVKHSEKKEEASGGGGNNPKPSLSSFVLSFKVTDKDAAVKPKRPDFPYKEEDDRNKFWIIWSPYNQFISPLVFNTKPAARAAAKKEAAKNPGTDWYVMESVKFAYKAEGNPVEKDPI